MKRHHAKTAVGIGISVFCIWAGFGLLLYSWPERGTLGDMFGAVNALFSGLALAGVIYAIILQHDELDQTKAEFSRNAQAQKQAAELQALTLLFQEYKELSEEKDEEINRVIGNQTALETGFYNTLLKERDVILIRKNHIRKTLEKTAGLE